MQNNQEMDRLTELPNPVLSSIISRLPLREAVATSILSRPWRTIWRSLYRMDIDPLLIMNVNKEKYEKFLEREEDRYYEFKLKEKDDLFENEICDSIPIIDYVFSCKEEHITSCHFVHYSNNDSFSNCLIRWIKLLTEREPIQELSLSYRYLHRPKENENDDIDDVFLIDQDDNDDFLVFESNYPDTFIFPVSIFRCQTLRKLELSKYNINSACPFEGCKNLKNLILNSLKIRGEILEKILLSCTSLEDLTLRSCQGLGNLEIYNNGLKRLEIWSSSAQKFHVSAGGRIVLVIHNLLCDYEKLIIDCPNIRVLRASWEPREGNYKIHDKILDQCSGLWEISHTDYPPLLRKPYQEPCENLRELCISFDMNNIKLKVFLRYIFSMCAHLHSLGITNQETPTNYVNPLHRMLHISWDDLEVFDSVFQQLRSVWIKGFTGKYLEIKLVSYLITNATEMNRLVIQCDDKCSKSGAIKTMGLLLLPRASINGHVMLKPCPTFTAGNDNSDFNSWVSTLN